MYPNIKSETLHFFHQNVKRFGNSSLEGIITDRDIVIRAIAEGKNPSEEEVVEYMTEETYACNEDDSIQDAADEMRKHQVSRLMVKNEDGKITGILTFGAILRKDNDSAEISEVIDRAVGGKAA